MNLNVLGKLLALPVLSCFSISLLAQEFDIGEKIPDIKLSNVFNYPDSEFKLSDFKGKVIILDFWSHNCTSCIEAFDKMDSLQKKFKNKIQVIAVNKEGKDTTERFFRRHKKIKIPGIPFVTADSMLSKFFPHKFVPWHVWIDTNLIVLHITSGYNATPKNVSAVLRGEDNHLAELTYVADYDYTKPLISEGNGRWLGQIEYYSFIGHCIPTADVSNLTVSTTGTSSVNHITRNCASVKTLLITAFGERNKYDFSSDGTLIFEMKDTFNYKEPHDYNLFDKWQSENSYDYDLLLPPSKSEIIYKMMQQDILRYFDLNAHIEKRKIKSLVLIRIDKQDKLKTKGGSPFLGTTDSGLIVRNKPLPDLFWTLQYKLKPSRISLPFINGTNYRTAIDLDINNDAIDPVNLLVLKKGLRKYGLDIVERELPTDVLVVGKGYEKRLPGM